MPGKTEYTIPLQKDVLRLEAQVVTGVATTVASQNAANAVAVVSSAGSHQVPAPTMENSIQGKMPGAPHSVEQRRRPGRRPPDPDPRHHVDQRQRRTTVCGRRRRWSTTRPSNEGENAISRRVAARRNRAGMGSSARARPAPRTTASTALPTSIPTTSSDRDPQGRLGVGDLWIQGVGRRRHHHDEARDDREAQVDRQRPGRPLRLARTVPDPARSPRLGARRLVRERRHARHQIQCDVAADNALIASEYAGPQNYQTQLFGNSQAAYQSDVSVSGTSGTTQYFLSGLSKYDNGIMLNTGYNKQSVRSNVTEQFAPNLAVTANLNYVHDSRGAASRATTTSA